MRGSEFTASRDVVCARPSVSRDHMRASSHEQAFDVRLKDLGWHVDSMTRNVIGCEQGRVCGCCGYGCAVGAKQSATKTWLADAQHHGAKFLIETRAEKVRIDGGFAVGVEAWS